MNFKNLKSDFPASIVVFFVALPLCLGIALASGAPLLSGLIAGVIGGLVVGFLSGSNLFYRISFAGILNDEDRELFKILFTRVLFQFVLR